MNFAFSALLIFLLLIPGILFNYGYLKGFGRRNGPTAIKRYGDYLVHSTIYALILNSLWALWISWIVPISIDWDAVIRLLSNKFAEEDGLPAISDHMAEVVLYVLGLYFVSAALGYFFHKAVRAAKLDKQYPLFRPDDMWFYMLSGEIVEFTDAPFSKKLSADNVDVFLTAIVTHGVHTYQYRGFVFDFGYNEHGELDWISLLYFDRFLLEKKSPGAQEESDGGFFKDWFKRERSKSKEQREENESTDSLIVLKYSEMNAIGLTYISLQKTTKPLSSEIY